MCRIPFRQYPVKNSGTTDYTFLMQDQNTMVLIPLPIFISFTIAFTNILSSCQMPLTCLTKYSHDLVMTVNLLPVITHTISGTVQRANNILQLRTIRYRRNCTPWEYARSISNRCGCSGTITVPCIISIVPSIVTVHAISCNPYSVSLLIHFVSSQSLEVQRLHLIPYSWDTQVHSMPLRVIPISVPISYTLYAIQALTCTYLYISIIRQPHRLSPIAHGFPLYLY